MWDLIIPVASDRGFGRSNLNTDKKKKKKEKERKKKKKKKVKKHKGAEVENLSICYGHIKLLPTE